MSSEPFIAKLQHRRLTMQSWVDPSLSQAFGGPDAQQWQWLPSLQRLHRVETHMCTEQAWTESLALCRWGAGVQGVHHIRVDPVLIEADPIGMRGPVGSVDRLGCRSSAAATTPDSVNWFLFVLEAFCQFGPFTIACSHLSSLVIFLTHLGYSCLSSHAKHNLGLMFWKLSFLFPIVHSFVGL